MLKLSQFLEVPEGVEFIFLDRNIKNNEFIYKIENNKLIYKDGKNWNKSELGINDILRFNIQRKILTDVEREYLKAVIKIYNGVATHICLNKSIEGHIDFISIEKEIRENVFADLAMFNITEKLTFNKMKPLEHYTLADLDLEE